MSPMDLKDVRLFLAVAEERNFTRAAERLHMAQPPLSRRIKALEDRLGGAVFSRTPHGVELTEAGQTLVREAQNLLRVAQHTWERTQRAAQGLTGQLDVGLFGSGVLDVVPRLLARFHQERPDVRIVLHNLSKAEQLQALRERRLSVGFNRLVPSEPDLVVKTVLREPMVVAMQETHPLARRRLVRVKDLAGQPLILYPSAQMHGLAQEVEEAFRQERVELVVEQSVQDVVTAVALVAGGFGLVVTTHSASNLRLPGVVFVPFQSKHLKDLELSCIFRRADSSPVLKSFLRVVENLEIPSIS